MKKMIWFDMDGTIADLYGVDNWLEYLINEETYPYDAAAPMINFSLFARLLHKVQRNGYGVGIISWTSKNGTDLYNGEVAIAKMTWLYKHLKSVQWDEIKIVPYGTNKYQVCGDGILFDDEEGNRAAWQDKAYTPEKIIEILRALGIE